MNDGSAHEATEPTKDDLTPLGEEDDIVNDSEDSSDEEQNPDEGCAKEACKEATEPTKDDLTPLGEEDTVEIIDKKDIENDGMDISPIGPTDVVPDEVNAPQEDMEYDKVANQKPDTRYLNDGSDPKVGTFAEADYMQQVAAISTGDNFKDVMNMGLDVAPEEIEPGSDDELLDDEAIRIVESEF